MAVEALLTGADVTKTARKVGVDRRTVQRWLQEPEMQARLNARRREIWGETQDRLRRLALLAIEVTEATLIANDHYVARDVLRILGPVLTQGLGEFGPEDPDEIRRRHQLKGVLKGLRADLGSVHTEISEEADDAHEQEEQTSSDLQHPAQG